RPQRWRWGRRYLQLWRHGDPCQQHRQRQHQQLWRRYLQFFGTLSAANSTISDNIGWGSGGGILNVAAPNTTVVNATVTLTSSMLSGNVAYGSDFVSYNALPIPGSGSVSGGGGGGGCDPSNCIPFQSSKSQIFAIMGGGYLQFSRHHDVDQCNHFRQLRLKRFVAVCRRRRNP